MSTSSSAERTRSPRAPKHSLNEALSYARAIYNGVHRSTVPSAMAFELMGFNGKSGSSSTALGSVRQFGLVEGTGDKTRISDLALTIFEPSSPEEKSEAIQTAAERPDVFQAIRTRFNDRIPAADEPIRAFLIRELGFQKASADDTLKSLRDTEDFAKSNTHTVTAPETERLQEHAGFSDFGEGQGRLTSQPNSDSIRVPLTKDCYAELRFTGLVSSKAIANLVRYIDLMKDVWTDNEEDQ